MHHPFEPEKSLDLTGLKQEPLLRKVMENGQILIEKEPLTDIAKFSSSRLQMLPEEHKRFNNPHIYKVGISDQLRDQRTQLRNQYRK